MHPDSGLVDYASIPRTRPLQIYKQSTKANIEESPSRISYYAQIEDSASVAYPQPASPTQTEYSCDLEPPLRSPLSMLGTGSYLSSENRASDGTTKIKSVSDRPTAATSKNPFYPDESQEILGNFIPMDSSNKLNLERASPEKGKASRASEETIPATAYFQVKNPYEFEPDSPYLPQMRQPTFEDFKRRPVPDAAVAQRSHTKNELSVDNANQVDQDPTPVAAPTNTVEKDGTRMFRSESSPNIGAGSFQALPVRDTASPSLLWQNYSRYSSNYEDGEIPMYYTYIPEEYQSSARRSDHIADRLSEQSTYCRVQQNHAEHTRRSDQRSNGSSEQRMPRWTQQAYVEPIRGSDRSGSNISGRSTNKSRKAQREYTEAIGHNEQSNKSEQISPGIRREDCPEMRRSRSPNRRDIDNYGKQATSHSPIRPPRHDSLQPHTPQSHDGHPSTTPLRDVVEEIEYDETGYLPGHYSPHTNVYSPILEYPERLEKRSRSPMKKMFGEKGWLGSSADENFTPPRDSKTPTKKSSTPSKNAHGGQKKTTMIEKLKNKFEEFAEKAELNTSPKRGSREKNAKLSLLDVSISPPDQANIAVETELMLVQTANTFLMNQFKKGRFRVETIKRTVDTWTSKGRPLVIEFMYDQITQHSLVAANLSTFRFHGPRAADEIRISSMLYNWKQVANLMAIRTFCNGDTVLLKLLFDIEQILELLGADEPRMLQLQQIRAAAHEMIRVVRSAKEENLASQSGGDAMGRVGWSTYLASEGLSNGGGLVGGGSYVGLF